MDSKPLEHGLPLDEELFAKELRELVFEWKRNWAGEGQHGPTMIYAGRAEVYGAGLEHHMPEHDAFRKVVEYCATALAYASFYGNKSSILEVIAYMIDEHENPRQVDRISPKTKVEFFNKVAVRALELLQDINVQDGVPEQKSIAALISTQRGKVNRNCTFGLEPNSSSTQQSQPEAH